MYKLLRTSRPYVRKLSGTIRTLALEWSLFPNFYPILNSNKMRQLRIDGDDVDGGNVIMMIVMTMIILKLLL